MRKASFALLILFSLSAWGQLPVTLEVKATTWNGAWNPSGARVNAPFTQGFPLPDAERIKCAGVACAIGTSPDMLQLQKVSDNSRVASQFVVTGLWSSGNVKWLMVDGQIPSLALGGWITA
jgi:hypothetical protein